MSALLRRIYPYIPVALLLAVMFLLCWHTLTSIYQDIGRHLTLGRIIWETKSVPRTNLFSYTAPDFPFVNHHWLGEVLLYLGERAVGLAGLIAVKAVIMTAAFVLALFAAWRRHLLVPSLGIGLVAAFIIAERTDVRPEMFSFLFLAWYLFVLYRKPHAPWLWSLPVVQLLWVNTHIYFFMGPLIFCAWTAGLIAKDGWSALRMRQIWLLGILITLATLANPWFVRGALYPFTIFGNYGYSIVENQSWFFLHQFGYRGLPFAALIAGIALVAVSFVLNRKNLRHNLFSLLIAVCSAVFAFMMVRNFPLFALIMMPVILRNLDGAGIRWERRGLLLAVAGLGLVIAGTISGQMFRRLGGMRFGLYVPPGHQAAVDYFRSAGLSGPIFNNFDVGSFLIWKLPEEKVFIDGRPEAYPADFIQGTYIPMQERQDAWEAGVAKYGIRTVLWNVADITPWSRTFVARIRKDPDWPSVYSGNGIEIFVRKGGE